MPPKKGFFVAIYGLDGVGKSTLVSGLAKSAKFRDSVNFDDYKKEIENPYALSKDKVLQLGMDDVEFFHYVGSNIFQGKIISELLNNGKTVFKSRWYLDILADFNNRGLPVNELIDDKTPFLIPDLSVLLVASDDIRMKRINSRTEAPNENDLNLKRSIAISEYFDKALSKSPYNSRNFIRIETNTKTPEEIATIIENFITK